MKASEFIEMLNRAVETYGDQEIVGGYLADDIGPTEILPLKDDGTEARAGGNASGFFITC